MPSAARVRSTSPVSFRMGTTTTRARLARNSARAPRLKAQSPMPETASVSSDARATQRVGEDGVSIRSNATTTLAAVGRCRGSSVISCSTRFGRPEKPGVRPTSPDQSRCWPESRPLNGCPPVRAK